MAFEFTDVDITKIIRGDTFDRTFQIGAGFTLTPDMRVKAQVRELDDSPEPVLTFDTADSSIVIDGQDIRLKRAATAMTIPVGNYYYDVQFTSLDGEVTTLFGGKFQIKQDYTR